MNDLRTIRRHRFLAIFMVLSATCHTTFIGTSDAASCVPPPSGILSWWEGEGDATDAMAVNNGTLAGNAVFGPGEVGQGFVLDGNGAAVQIGDAPGLQLQDFTIEAWVARANLSQVTTYWTGIGFIFAYGVGGYGFAADNSGHLVLSAVGVSSVSSPVVLTDTSFHHVAVTKSGSSVIFYKDGVAYSAASYNPGFTFTSPAAIGAQGNDLTSSFWGTIDELAVYDRALTPDEIQSIFAAGNAGKCTAGPPVITSPPTNVTVIAGRTATFNVSAHGTLPLSFQWLHYGTNLPGATGNALLLNNVQSSDEGPYAAQVTNALGSATSSEAMLSVLPYACTSAPPGLLSWWEGDGDGNDSGYGGNDGILAGGAVFGPGEVGQGFALNGNGAAIRIGNAPSLQLQDFTIEAWVARANSSQVTTYWTGIGFIFAYGVGGYGFAANNSGQLVLSAVGVTSVSSPVVLTDTVFHHVAVTKTGDSVIFYLDGVAYPAASYSSRFTFSSPAAVGAQGNDLTSSFWGTIDELTVYNRALSADEIGGIYAAGQSGKCALPPIPPTISSQPTGRTVAVGATTTLSVGVSGSRPLSYQWHFNNADLTRATNSTLTLTNVQASNAGPYSVTITNALGSVTSSNAQLKVTVVSVYANNVLLTNSQYSFGGPFTLRLTNAYPTGSIFYTLDGSEPSFLSAQYSAPFTVSSNVVLRAIGYSSDFSQEGETDPMTLLIVPTYTLSVTNNGGGGSIALSPSGGSYLSNTVVTVTANPASGWTFLQWLGDLSGTNPVASVTMTRNKTVKAIFGTTLNTTAAGSGSVVLNPPGGLYPYGTVVWLSGIPQPGNYFGVWGNAASGNTNPLPFTVTNANPTISSLFAAVGAGQAALTVVPVGKGRITVAPRANVYTTGQGVNITATADPGQRFLGWSGDATGSANPLSVTMTANKTIYANFTHNPSLSFQASYEGLKPDGFVSTLTGDFGARYEIDASSNLVNWASLTIVTNSYGSVTFTDPAAPSLQRRFYRALLLP